MSQRAKRPTEVIAERMRELRNGRGWSAQRLAEEMTKVGIPWDRSIVANIENGRRASIAIEEVLALAYVLSVAPVHLIVPPVDGEATDLLYRVAPEVATTTPGFARAWIRGQTPIGKVSARRYFSEVPESEWQPPPGQWSPDNIERQSRIVEGNDGAR
jgi:transcriptional regulator with XRE-family HTH domain